MSKNFKIDYQRKERIGFPEVIFGASKSLEQLDDIIHDYRSNQMDCLITRVQEKKG
jgi:NCAIR mutase (PurE)-related protein